MLQPPRPKTEDRFWSKVDRRGPNGCWVWTGFCRAHTSKHLPYGTFWVGNDAPKKTKYAHRFSWEIANGDIPYGMFVMHRCDNPKCVNPEHLFLGSHHDNMRDMAIKGRKAKQSGAMNSQAKLNESVANEIIAARDELGIGYGALACRFGVSASTVGRVIRGECWNNASAS